MAYPPARYHGETGEVSAWIRPADRPPEVVYPNGTVAHYIAQAATTDGLFGIYRWEMPGGAGGPGPHFHRTIAESFYILAGSVEIHDGNDWVSTQAGAFVHVPAGGWHGFRNASDAPASMLIHFAPGAPREGYFETLAAWARDGRPDDEALVDEFYRAHDNIWR
jgi:mannose-6-phosphate isomerase-like protein (cupin superfamily)